MWIVYQVFPSKYSPFAHTHLFYRSCDFRKHVWKSSFFNNLMQFVVMKLSSTGSSGLFSWIVYISTRLITKVIIVDKRNLSHWFLTWLNLTDFSCPINFSHLLETHFLLEIFRTTWKQSCLSLLSLHSLCVAFWSFDSSFSKLKTKLHHCCFFKFRHLWKSAGSNMTSQK